MAENLRVPQVSMRRRRLARMARVGLPVMSAAVALWFLILLGLAGRMA